jgi:septal ring factor EnvC (AmiA/AmiB activator)
VSNNLGLFLLFSVLVTGLIVNPYAFAQETTVNATGTDATAIADSVTTSVNATETEDDMAETEDDMAETEDDMAETEDDMAETEDDMAETEDDMAETEDDVSDVVPSPLKQIKEGITPENIVCKEGLELVFKLNGQPACIKTSSIPKLIAWGWAK